MRKPTPAWPLFASEWHSRWPLCKVVKHSFGLLTSAIQITSILRVVVCVHPLKEFCRSRSLSLVDVVSFGGSF